MHVFVDAFGNRIVIRARHPVRSDSPGPSEKPGSPPQDQRAPEGIPLPDCTLSIWDSGHCCIVIEVRKSVVRRSEVQQVVDKFGKARMIET